MGGVVLVLDCCTCVELYVNQAAMLIDLLVLWPQRSQCSFSGCLLRLQNKYGPSNQGHEVAEFWKGHVIIGVESKLEHNNGSQS